MSNVTTPTLTRFSSEKLSPFSSPKNMVLRNSANSPTSSPKKVKILKMDSPRNCSTKECNGAAFKSIGEHGKVGVEKYYCEKCINNVCLEL